MPGIIDLIIKVRDRVAESRGLLIERLIFCFEIRDFRISFFDTLLSGAEAGLGFVKIRSHLSIAIG